MDSLAWASPAKGLGATDYACQNRDANGNGRYIQRNRIFVNSNERIAEESQDGWTFAFEVPQEIHNVVAIELYQYNVPRDTGPTFSGVYDFERALAGVFKPQQTKSSAKTPLYVEFKDEAGAPSITQISDLDPAGVWDAGSSTLQSTPVADYILATIYVQDTFFTDWSSRSIASGTFPAVGTNYSSEPANSFLANQRVNYRLYNTTTPGNYARIDYLYKTGNVDTQDNTARVFGFNPYKDKSSNSSTGDYIVADYLLNVRPYRYLDVFIDEIDELKPIARIPLVDATVDGFVTNENPPRLPRVLLRTVERLRKLHVRLRLENNRIPPTVADTGVDLVFDVYSLAPIQKLPNWVNQTFAM